jgi:halogenation protein CepH
MATLLAQAGRKVLILEKSAFPRYQIGESLLPATVRDLADMLGVREKMAEAGFVSKRGATFSWGATPDDLWHLNFGGIRSEETDLDPNIPAALNVRRQDFDRILLENAVEKGVEVRFGCRAERMIEDEGTTTGLQYTDPSGGKVNVGARYVADASGQRSTLSRHFGKRSFSSFFRKIAIWRYYDGGGRLPEPLQGNVLFQTAGDSWLWYIPVDDKTTSVGVVAPASDWTKGDCVDAFLDQKIADCPLTTEYLANASVTPVAPYDQTRVCSEYSYSLSSFWKPGALALGDAACFVDVLLSSGVHLATYAAVLAAQSVNSILDGTVVEEVALNEYETRLRREYAIFYDGLVGLYDMTQRPDDYAGWLRNLLGDTSGIAFDDDEAIPANVVLDDAALLARSRNNLAAMRRYNESQNRYDGAAAMRAERLAPLPATLYSDVARSRWLRAI